MILPGKLGLQIKEWKEKDFEVFNSLTKRVSKISGDAGQNSGEFKRCCKKLEVASECNNIHNAIKSHIDVRALFYMLANSASFHKKIKIDQQLFAEIIAIRRNLSKLSLLLLVRAFFFKFDFLRTECDRLIICNFIKLQLDAQENIKPESELGKIKKVQEIVFNPEGPFKVVSATIRTNKELVDVLDEYGLRNYKDSRFYEICHYHYYLEQLKRIPVGSDHKILAELIKRDVYEAPYKENKLLGHEILSIIIDRTNEDVSESWQRVILAIAGDPRISNTNQRFMKWWFVLGENRTAKVRGWLSGFDLKLFLYVLKQSAQDQHNLTMERLFESRKKFMEGLLDLKLIVDSRLFLSSGAERYLKQHYPKDELPNFGRAKPGEVSMIYLHLMYSGKSMHMVEGSHNFKAKLLRKLPKQMPLNSYAVNDINLRDYQGIPSLLTHNYIRNYGNDGGCVEVRHYPELAWQNQIINFLWDNGIKVTESSVISKARYRDYRNRFGLR